MAATVQMKDSKTGEVRWFYTVDAKEILSQPGNTWEMTGAVERSGWATPSAQSQRPSTAVPVKSQAEQIADGIAEGLARAFGGAPAAPAAPVAPEVPEPSGDPVSAGPPTEESLDALARAAEANGEGADPADPADVPDPLEGAPTGLGAFD